MPMPQTVDELIRDIRRIEEKIDAELEKGRGEFRYQIEKGEVVFERELLARHRGLKKGLLKYLSEVKLGSYLVSPVIYSMIVPAVVLDIFITLYHAICFPVYGIPKVRRSDFIIFDRHKLGYLNLLEKINCNYCAYLNGLVAYTQEIAALTEQHFCPIAHAKKPRRVHSRYHLFFGYGDAERYKNELAELRERFEDLKEKAEENG